MRGGDLRKQTTKAQEGLKMTNKQAYELVRKDWKPGKHLIDLWLYQYNRKYMRLIRKCIKNEAKQNGKARYETVQK